MSSHAALLVELLTEELPARGLRALGERFALGIRDGLIRLGLAAADTPHRAFATPRRLAVLIDNVAQIQPDQLVERKGPALAAGLKEGVPTPALLGFAKSCGVAVAALEQTGEGKAAAYVFRSTKPGQTLSAHLAGLVEQVVKALPAPKLMRWGASDVQFIRPIQGLVMLHGTEVVAGTVLEMPSARSTRGHRFLGAATLALVDAATYEAALATPGGVTVSFERRTEMIASELASCARDATLADAGLIEEVAGLVEHPAVYAGRFDAAFLAVPQECLMLTMTANQKYFPLLDATGALLNRFLLVSNMAIAEPKQIIAGNERVLRARLSDAKFFFDQDRKHRLSELVAPLDSVVYHNKLGTQLERTQRIERLAEIIAGSLGTDTIAARRAAHLCKADLMSGMVGEFPELQGTMGMYYARHDGELDVVARAIEGHYRPRQAGGPLPEDAVGDCVALADKLDTLVGISGIGLGPTGDKDPFGLRRAALGVLRILVEHSRALDLHHLILQAREGYSARDGHSPHALSADVVEQVFGFVLDRLRAYLRDRDFAPDEIDAVLTQAPRRIDRVLPRIEAVRLFRKLPEAASLAAANKRIGNLLKKSAGAANAINANLFTEPAEHDLYAALGTLAPEVEKLYSTGDYTQALHSLANLRAPVDAFFEKVLVNADDAQLRANRLALLERLSRLLNQVADISKLAT